jgi:hypothetical protein
MATALDLAATVGMTRAAAAFAVPRASLYRAQQQPGLGPPAPRPSPPRALTPGERQGVLDVFALVMPPLGSSPSCTLISEESLSQ